MKSSNIITLLLFSTLTAGCGGGGGADTPPPPAPANSGGGGSSPVTGTGSNVLAVTVNDPANPNKPTVSVTVCTPGTSNCQTIDNILLDTGSYGLRIFKQFAQNLSLPQVNVVSGPLAECTTFADGSGEWGPVRIADVVLGGETASNVPIQVIDANYFPGAIPRACQSPNVTNLDQDPGSVGFNGILGVGLFASDCGQGCADSAHNSVYYTCSGSRCVGASVPVASQVQNPVALLEQDNNGVIVQMPPVSPGGMRSVTGQLILGIGTRSNNAPSGVTAYPADSNGEFTTVFNGATLPTSFIDSGSNGLFFNDPASLLPLCSSPDQGWFCSQYQGSRPTEQELTATNRGSDGLPSGFVKFSVGNATELFNSASNSVFSELGGSAPPGSGFDWGLPFFFGRSIYVGIEGGKSSTLGSGPYWAY